MYQTSAENSKNPYLKILPAQNRVYHISIILPQVTATLPNMDTEIQELAERTSEKPKKLTGEEFAGLMFLPAEDME